MAVVKDRTLKANHNTPSEIQNYLCVVKDRTLKANHNKV